MYDNLDLVLSNEQVPGTDFIKTIPQYLTAVSNQGVNQFGEYVTGYLDTLKVKVTASRVKIYDSSFCKYYLGDNFKTMSKGDTQRAIEKISDIFNLPFALANVTRIDIAKNLIMQYDEKVYYPYLGEAQYYNRLEQNNGLYYSNQIRQLVFYGKEYEQKLKGQPIPDIYKNRHTLRFEMRYRRKLREQLKQPQITAGLLYDESFYGGLVKRWKDEYLAIQKINSKLIRMKPTGSTKELIENMALFQLLDMGQPKVLSLIQEWEKTGLITKKQGQDHRNKIKMLGKIPKAEKGNDLINELNKKIKEASRYW